MAAFGEAPGVAAQARSSAATGRVLAVTGSQASVQFPVGGGADEAEQPTVGKFLGIVTGGALLVGVITKVAAPPQASGGEPSAHAVGQVDLLGEIKQPAHGGELRFARGVTHYPAIGDAARLISRDELRLIYDLSAPNTAIIGQLQEDASISASVNVDQMLSKHFAIFGTTGVGKSSGVALLLQRVMLARPDLRIFLIDPHNEYGRCFGNRAQVLNPRNLKLPFWLFSFEETVDVFFRGRPGVEEEVEVLSEVVPIAKAMFAAERGQLDRSSIRKYDPRSTGFTIDTPVPYRLQDLVALVDDRMGKLENRAAWTKYHRLIARIEAVRNDPRYAFMFDNANVGGDTMVEVLSQLFRLPTRGQPMTVMQLAGFPAEVVDSVVSVLARMAFDFGLWSDGAAPLLFVCEEAHRYAPADRAIGFGPTRKAISRVAKEGRKYGVFLGLITQRPAELDATIISQCSTLFAMRMANDRDQAIVRAAVSDAAASLLGFVPSLGTREVFAFGEGVALPTRLHFAELPAHLLPRSEAVGGRANAGEPLDEDFIAAVVERWRGAMLSHKLRGEERQEDDFEAAMSQEFSALPPKFDGDRERLVQSLRELPPPSALLPSATSASAVSPPLAPPAPTPGSATQAFHSDLQDLRRRLRTRGSP